MPDEIDPKLQQRFAGRRSSKTSKSLRSPMRTTMVRTRKLVPKRDASPKQAIELIERLHEIRGAKKPLTQLHRLTTSDDVRAAIEDAIDLPQAAASYWV